MAAGTWATREVPVLEAIAARSTSLGGPRWEEVVEDTGLPAEDVQLALRRLYDAGYIDGVDVTAMGDAGFEILEIKLLEAGLRVVGVWPNDAYDELLTTLELRIANESDPDRRGKLERLRDGVLDMGKAVATSVVTEVVKRTAGL